MAECIKCEISFNYGKKFCKNCGSPLIESKDILSKAKNLIELKKFDEALNNLEKIPSFSFFKGSADFYKIKIYYEKSEYSKIKQLIINIGKLKKELTNFKNLTYEDKLELSNILLDIGSKFVEQGELKKADVFITKAENLSPEISDEKLGEIYFNIGKKYFDKKDIDNSIEAFLQSKKLGIDESKLFLSRSYFIKAQKHYNSGNLKDANVLIKKAISLNPDEKTYSVLNSKIEANKKDKLKKKIIVGLAIVSAVLLVILIPIAYNSLFQSKPEISKIKFNEGDVKAKVKKYLKSNMQASVGYVTSLYADNVDFYKSGIVDKDFIRNDKKKYFTKWPERKISLIDVVDVKYDSVNGNWIAKFDYHYQIKNLKRRLKGDAWCELTFAENNNALVIISEKGGIKKKKNLVKVGNQIWMTKNLNVSHFRNGEQIPQATSPYEWRTASENREPAWCYYENDPKNRNEKGKLYNWYAVNDPRGLAPKGFHIPSIQEFEILLSYNDGNGFNIFSNNEMHEPVEMSGKRDVENYDNGFSGGYTTAYFWSNTSDYNLAYYLFIYMSATSESRAGVDLVKGNKNNGYSVRCIKNYP